MAAFHRSLPTIVELDDESEGVTMVEPATREGFLPLFNARCNEERNTDADPPRLRFCLLNDNNNHHRRLDDMYPQSLIQSTVQNAGPIAWVVSLILLLHLSLCVYALIRASNSPAFHDACGSALRDYAALRLGGGWAVLLALMYMVYTPFTALGCCRWGLCALACGGHVASFMVGTVLMRSAVAHDACLAAMADASFTRTPLLVIVCGGIVVEDVFRAAVIGTLLLLRIAVERRRFCGA